MRTGAGPKAATSIWLDLPGGVDVGELLEQAEENGRGLSVKARGLLSPAPAAESSARLAFSFATPDEIDRGVGLLASAVRLLAGAGRGAGLETRRASPRSLRGSG